MGTNELEGQGANLNSINGTQFSAAISRERDTGDKNPLRRMRRRLALLCG
jgi:hypothetical protein